LSTYWASNWPIWISAFCILAVYTYLFKDNPLYRVMMQVFIGVNLGYQAIIQWQDVLYPHWWLPMMDGFRALLGGPGSPWGALWFLVGVIGFLFYLQLSRKYAPYSKIAIGITIGIGAGLTFKSQFGLNIPQILDSFKPLAPAMVRAQPRTVIRLPGSDFMPTVDDSLAFFVSGSRVEADDVLGGVRLWRTTLPLLPSSAVSVKGEEVLVPTENETIRLDRSSGRILGSAVVSKKDVPLADAREAVAIYHQPQYANSVQLTVKGNELLATAFRDSVAEGVHSGDLLWTAQYGEAIIGIQSFDGVALVAGKGQSAIWEIPVPQPKLAFRDYVDNWVSVITVFCVMTYFFFSFKRRGPVIIAASTVGRLMLMIGFGAFFGNTVMTRMSILLERMMFLIDDWLRPFWHAIFK